MWVQKGAYVLIAFSEIVASITGLEYAFTNAPKNMCSLVLGVLAFFAGIGFWFSFRQLDAEESLNALDERERKKEDETDASWEKLLA